MKNRKQAYMYMDTLPETTGSGAQLRFFSNVRAYLDLGFEVEIVQIGEPPSNPIPPLLQNARHVHLPPEPVAKGLIGKLTYRMGLPTSQACRYYYRKHVSVLRAFLQRERHCPGAIHQFEGDSIANVVPFIGKAKRIYSAHDLSGRVLQASHSIEQQLGNQPHDAAVQRREERFVSRLERRIADRSDLVLCISLDDRDTMRREWSCDKAEYLPMSVANENEFDPRRSWTSSGHLRVLHVGAIAHLPSYRSLEYLFTEVFPKMDVCLRRKVRLRVVGRYDASNERCMRIRALAQPFMDSIEFTGFLPNMEDELRNADIQIVTSTQASGLRTRIVEAFAWGVPVLATSVASKGLVGLNSGENILVADRPQELIAALASVLEMPGQLGQVAGNARQTYCRFYSRQAVERAMSGVLEKYFRLT